MIGPGPTPDRTPFPVANTRLDISCDQAATSCAGESAAEDRLSITPGRPSTDAIASGAKVTGRDEPNMKIPFPPGPNARVTWGKTSANVRTWALSSSTV